MNGMDELNSLLKGNDWFANNVCLDMFGRYIVYVHFMNESVLRQIPDTIDNKQVLVHFIGNLTATRDKFVDKFGQTNKETQSQAENEIGVGQLLDSLEDEKSILHLQNELDRLEKNCGSSSLQDIFYEIQDGHNAVTQESIRYPEVRKSLEKLFDQYGFDVIYEELDG